MPFPSKTQNVRLWQRVWKSLRCVVFLQRGQCDGEFVHIPDSGSLCGEYGHCSWGWVINGYCFLWVILQSMEVSCLAVDILCHKISENVENLLHFYFVLVIFCILKSFLQEMIQILFLHIQLIATEKRSRKKVKIRSLRK